MDQSEATVPQTNPEGSPSGGGASAKAASGPRAPIVPSVPDYDLLQRIGGGAYGDVWLARSRSTGILRAAKIVWRHTFEDDRPFQREFEGIQRFEKISREHPSQLALFHIGRNEAQGYFYCVMELADNLGTPTEYRPHTLRADLETGALPAGRVLEIGLALAEALEHLHRKGLIHRDVKPSNVIFVNGSPKLADIGLVTDASDQCSIVGTEGYLPPEGPGTAQADIFALGKVFYEAMTGSDRREFPKFPPGLRTSPNARHVFELNEIVLKACAPDLKQRYQNCSEIHADLVLLKQGKSLKEQRAWRKRWVVGNRTVFALIFFALAYLGLSLLPRHSRRSEFSSDGPDSTNLEANAFCDKALYALRGDSYDEFKAAYTNFNEAIRLDPNFARPYVGLFELQLREVVPGLPVTTPEVLRSLARHLEQLAPDLAATYCAQSAVAWSDWKYPEAERRALQAIRADPGYELGHTWYAYLLICFGRPEEAERQVGMSQKAAPSKATTYQFVGNVYWSKRDYTNAIAWYKTAIKWEPHEQVSYMLIGRAMQALNDYTNSVDYLEKADLLGGEEEAIVKPRYIALRQALDHEGVPGYWRQQWRWTENNTNTDFYWKAVIQIRLGNTNAALAWLQKSFVAREGTGDYIAPLNLLLSDEYWVDLHDDPRFKKLLDEIGFTSVMPSR
jgi:serine/threonine protein kinase